MFSSITKILAYFWHSKKIWRKPRKAKVLICDRAGSEVVLTYLDPKSVEILDVRGESLNLYVLLKCLLHWKLSLINYMVQYLKCVEPSVALTFVDNNPRFYQLKSHQKDLITVFVQNGTRTEAGDVFGVLKRQTHVRDKYQVDFMLTFGNAIGQEYLKYIDGKIHPIGSFRNNFHHYSETQKQFKTVLFLSQYTPPPCSESSPMCIYDNNPIFWKQYYATEEFLLPLLQQYCLHNKLELKICMRSNGQAEEERNYFRALLGNESLELLKRSNLYSNYEKIAAAGFVVFVDTTLGYEALARGKKVAAFSRRGKSQVLASFKFGWPADLPNRGPFWTNHTDEREFKRVMDYITTVSDKEWEQTRQCYVPDLIQYDPGNTRFLDLMREIGVPLKLEYEKYI